MNETRIFEEIQKFNRLGKRKFGKATTKNLEKDSVLISDTLFRAKDDVYSISTSTKIWRTGLFALLATVFFGVFVVKAFVVQILQSDESKSLSSQNRIRKISMQPERGVVYDRNDNIVVRNKPAFSIEMNTDICSYGKRDLSLCKSTVDKVSEYVPVDKERVISEVALGKPSVILATGLDKNSLLKLEANISTIPSVTIVTSPQRDYIYKNILAHVVGYVGLGNTLYPTIIGKSGIEQYYDKYVSGVAGGRVIQVDSTGTVTKVLSEESSVPGKDIHLYLDIDLQKKAYELLEKTIKEKKAEAGSIVAQDPRTGGILALANYPSFDPDKLSSGISYEELAKLNNDPTFPFFNRAVSGTYPPGSTFKMVVASAALSEKVITENYQIFDPGYIQVGSYIFRNWKTSGHGDVDLRRALQVSNDTYFYTIGGGHKEIKGLGIEKLSKWAKRFGFGSKTGIDIEGEESGYMPDGTGRDWYLGDTYITSIGQGDVLATPLQVNNVTSYFANGGVLYKPRIVKSIFGEPNEPVEVIAKNLIDTKTYQTIREGMHMAVTPGGTGYPFFDFPQKYENIEVAGKTGTSEYYDSKGEAKTHALFTIFGPYADDKNTNVDATIALTVFLEGGGSGADAAAPIARELMDLWFKK